MSDCPDCYGKGFTWVEVEKDGKPAEVKEPCKTCDGTGDTGDDCQACQGSGGGNPPFRCQICRGTGLSADARRRRRG